MHFGIKNNLKSNYNHTPKHTIYFIFKILMNNYEFLYFKVDTTVVNMFKSLIIPG